MNTKVLAILLAASLLPHAASGQSPIPSTTPVIRIGVDMRLGYQTCLDSWTPVADYLSQTIPGHRFVVMPLASYLDTMRVLENGAVEFIILDPALEIVARDRFGASPLLSQIECRQGAETSPLSEKSSSTFIRRADRSDITGINDFKGKRLSAVRSWSLTGWLAAWELLKSTGLDPHTALKQVVFEGTNPQVVRNVLAGSSDVGVVDTQMLLHLIQSKKLAADAIYIIDRQGKAVPMTADTNASSTDLFPGRILSKTKNTSSDLAQRVAESLKNRPIKVLMDGVSYERRWGVPLNYSRVRQLLLGLMGPDFVHSTGYPLSQRYPEWLVLTLVHGSALGVFLIAFSLVRYRHVRRRKRMESQIEDLLGELREARAETQRINTILTLAGCGIDIVDENNRIVYADHNLEKTYGDWHGRKCHEYYCKSDRPCPTCERPVAVNEARPVKVHLDDSTILGITDPHARLHYIEGHATRMIGIPFSDEGGRWLYARLHIPIEAMSPELPPAQ